MSFFSRSPSSPLAGGDATLLLRIAASLLGLLVVIQVVWPFFGRGLDVELLRDDAYYMFDVAANFASGRGFTFDGEHAAGGVQVLWTLILALPALAFGKAALPVASIALGLLLLAGAGALAFRLARRYCDADAAFLLTLFLVSRPFLVREAMNGQETALGLFVLLVVVRRGLDALEGKRAAYGGLVTWTIVLPWARTELVLVPIALAVVYEVARRRRLIPPAANRRLEIAVALSCLIFAVLQKLAFGRFWPVSGDAIPWLFHDRFLATEPTLGAWLQRTWWYVRPLLLGGPWQILGTLFAAVLAAWVLAPLTRIRRFAPIVLVAIAAILGAEQLNPVFLAAVVLLVAGRIFATLYRVHEGCAVLGSMLGFAWIAVLHLVVRWYPRDYYWVALVVPAILATSVLAGRWLGELGMHALLPRPRRLRTFAWVLLLGALFDVGTPLDRFPWQAEMRFAAREASRLVGPSVGIAAFNAGLLGFEHDGPVRALDGVVDGAALDALRSRGLAAWLAAEGVTLVLDTPRQLMNVDPDPIGPHASGLYLGPNGAAELVPYIAFDLEGVAGRHPGTDCQVLAHLAGTAAPSIETETRVLARDEKTVTIFVPNASFVLSTEGRERPLRFAHSASKAPYVVTRLPASKSVLSLDGTPVLSW
ncbi:MAG: hypothetical protein KDC95_03365 [Planctomycetes bacterium]|nr:hypothetical protein [Planctomycetota bacterium]